MTGLFRSIQFILLAKAKCMEHIQFILGIGTRGSIERIVGVIKFYSLLQYIKVAQDPCFSVNLLVATFPEKVERR